MDSDGYNGGVRVAENGRDANVESLPLSIKIEASKLKVRETYCECWGKRTLLGSKLAESASTMGRRF
jgi:hypothetical protein